MMLVMSLKNSSQKKTWRTSIKILQCNNVQKFTMHNIIFRAHLPPHNFETWKLKQWIQRYNNSLQVPKRKLEKNKSSTFYQIQKAMWLCEYIGKGFGKLLENGFTCVRGLFPVCPLHWKLKAWLPSSTFLQSIRMVAAPRRGAKWGMQCDVISLLE